MANSFTKTFSLGRLDLDDIAADVAQQNYIDDDTLALTQAFANLSSNAALSAAGGALIGRGAAALGRTQLAGSVGSGAASSFYHDDIAQGVEHLAGLTDNLTLPSGRSAFAKPQTGAPSTLGAVSRTSGETAHTIAGRAAHKAYNPGPSYDKKFVLPSGKKPDAVDISAKVVRELKPNNAAAIQRGVRQVENYRRELQGLFGGNWKGIVDTY